MKLEELLDKLTYSTGYALMSLWWQVNRVIPIGRGCVSLAEFFRRLCSRGKKNEITIKRVTRAEGCRLKELETIENLQKAWELMKAKDGDALEVEYVVPISHGETLEYSTFYIPYYYPTPIKFPPYSLEELHKYYEMQVFHIGVLHAQQGDFDLTPMVKRWAGPKGNFYHDLTKEEGIHVQAKSLMIPVESDELCITNTMAIDFTFNKDQVVYWKSEIKKTKEKEVEEEKAEVEENKDDKDDKDNQEIKVLDDISKEAIDEVLDIMEKEKRLEEDDDKQTKAAAEYCTKRVPTPVPWKCDDLGLRRRKRVLSDTALMYDTPDSEKVTPVLDLGSDESDKSTDSKSSDSSDSVDSVDFWAKWSMSSGEFSDSRRDSNPFDNVNPPIFTNNLTRSFCMDDLSSPLKKQKRS